MKVFLFFAVALMLFSCSDDEYNTSKQVLLTEKESSLTAQEKIRELLLKTEGDYEQLACIFNNSPSSIKRLKNGETFATPEAEIEISKHYNYFIVKENGIKDFKADCISYKWYNYIKTFMSNWWFWVLAFIVIFILLKLFGNLEDDNPLPATLGLMILVVLFYVIIWIINYCFGQPVFSGIPDNFVNTLDTVWESKI